MGKKPGVSKKGDSRSDFPMGSTPSGQKPKTNRFGNTREPNRENTSSGQRPDVHRSGE